MTLITRFLTVEVPLTGHDLPLPQVIETALRQSGEPLRWAITGVDETHQTVQVEAVVTLVAAA